MLFPISLLAPLGKLYQILFMGEDQIDASSYLINFVGVLFFCLVAYCVFKFGLSLLSASINMIRGKEEETPKERIRALVKQKLNEKDG